LERGGETCRVFLYIASDERWLVASNRGNGTAAGPKWVGSLILICTVPCRRLHAETRPKQKSRISEGYVKGAGRRAGLYFLES
jgi:hypothetical protein